MVTAEATRQGDDPEAGGPHRRDQRFTGIAHSGSAGIGHERYVTAARQNFEQQFTAPLGRVGVKAQNLGMGVEVRQQSHGASRILGRDDRNPAQRLGCP